MTGKTHLIAGLAAGEAAQYLAGYYPGDPFFLGACLAGAIIPDICHSGSKIGRKLPFLSRIISLLFGHRTVTHSLFFMILAGLAASFFSISPGIRLGLLVGIGSHLLLDAATPQGVSLLWPLPWKVRLPVRTRTGGAAEHGFFVIIVVAALFMGWSMYIV